MPSGHVIHSMLSMRPLHSPRSPRPAQPYHPRHSVRGFTAIELLVTVVILGVLAALAGPSFTPLIERWRVRQAAEELQSTLYYARSEALKRGGRVAIQKLANTSGGCQNAETTQDWGCGWIIFEDLDSNGTWKTLHPTRAEITGDAVGR